MDHCASNQLHLPTKIYTYIARLPRISLQIKVETNIKEEGTYLGRELPDCVGDTMQVDDLKDR